MVDNESSRMRWIEMIKKCKYYLHIYKVILMQDLKVKMSYRADFVGSILENIISIVLEFITLIILLTHSDSLAGWNRYEMIFFNGFALMSIAPYQSLFSNQWNLSYNVLYGGFIKYCFRPVDRYFYFISETFDIKGVVQFLCGLIMVLFAWNNLDLPFNIFILIKIVFFWGMASLFFVGVMNFASATCFWIQHSEIVMTLCYRFKDYAKYPVTLFGPVLQVLFSTVIPIAFISYYPCVDILRNTEKQLMLWIAPVFSLFFFYISYKFWIKGANTYIGTGS